MSSPQTSLSANPSDETLVPTTDRIAQDCPRFRILIIGRTGTGKSSLINAIFKTSLADVQDNLAGTADINKGITSEHNDSLILHDSQGYEPGSLDKFDVLRTFIQRRSHQEQVAERLHAIWLCITVPFAGGRIFETGDEKIFQLDLNKVPIIVVFTKSDLFGARMGGKMSQESAEKQFKEMYSRSFDKVTRNMAGRIPYTLVAISRAETLQQLVKITMQSIHVNRTSPPSNVPFFRRILDRSTERNQPTWSDEDLPDSTQIALATAQRVDIEEKINASIRVGKQKYWRAIASRLFIGVNFQSCLNVIHKDIVAIWNVRGLNQYLLSNTFRDLMMVIVDDLHDQSASATNVKRTVSSAKRLVNIYQGLPGDIRFLMGYVVDFTLIMQAVFQVSVDDKYEGKVKVDRVKEIVYEYHSSETREKIHNTLSTLVEHPLAQNIVTERIESLIRENRMTENDTKFNHNRPTLPSLLTILEIEHTVFGEPKEISPISIILLRKLLDFQDYSGIATALDDRLDADLLLDFMLYVVRNGFLSNAGVSNANRKARILMYKLIKQTGVLPSSLFIRNIRKLDSIGDGGFGQVFKGEYNGSDVALTVLYGLPHEDDRIKEFCRETLFWRSLSHTYILPLLGIYKEKSELYLVSPYMKNGTLTEWRKKTQFSTAEIQQRMLEVAEGVSYIHYEGIVHGDLRGENVLVGSGPRCQIADFGLTWHLDATLTRWQSLVSVDFAAPELLGACNVCGGADCDSCIGDKRGWRRKKTVATDIYAFGCLYYAIFFDRVPFLNKTWAQIIQLVIMGERPSRPREPRMEDDVWSLIQDCWATNPSERPMMENVVARMKTFRPSS